jgi:hypothetical protein
MTFSYVSFVRSWKRLDSSYKTILREALPTKVSAKSKAERTLADAERPSVGGYTLAVFTPAAGIWSAARIPNMVAV